MATVPRRQIVAPVPMPLRNTLGAAAALALLPAARATPLAGDARAFLQQHCFECHGPSVRKADLDLEELTAAFDLASPKSLALWIKLHDRVVDGEMPPKEEPRPDAAAQQAFLRTLAPLLATADRARHAEEGRATLRRLNRLEYEATLRDLFDAPWLPVKDLLLEDGEAHRFNKVGSALDVSHVQLARYLSAAEATLRRVITPQVERPPTTTTRYYARNQRDFVSRINIRGPLNRRVYPLDGHEMRHAIIDRAETPSVAELAPAARDRSAMALVISTYQPTSIQFTEFRAPVSGRYRLRLAGYSVWMAPDFKSVSRGRRSEPVSLYAITPPRNLRKLASVDVTPDAAPTRVVETYLLAGEGVRPDAARLFRSWPPDHRNPLQTEEGMPAVAFQWLEVEGPLLDEWPERGHRLLFGELPLREAVASDPSHERPPPDEGDLGKLRRLPPMPAARPQRRVEAISAHPRADAARLLPPFLRHIYRRPPTRDEETRFIAVIHRALDAGDSFTEAMLTGYSAVLSSPGFLYLDESPGPLADGALAARLSYFLWNSAPDAELRGLAAAQQLRDPRVLRDQAGRLLADPRARRFVDAFTSYWLDLRHILATSPDALLYPDYQLDDLLLESAVEETQLFFAELLQHDLPVRHLVASDFAMLNERLAMHYDVPGVSGAALRRVPLPSDSVRGGLLTQAALLKVTANGTTTSPVIRGAWIMERILGRPPPPPPPNLPAVEPDTRGATTIREQLALHRDQPACVACHARIDPPGLALENFDVFGAWRMRYRSLGDGDPVAGIGHNSQRFTFKLAREVDASGALADGRAFRDIRELKQLLLADETQLARNLLRQWVTYATGAAPGFSDRSEIEAILARTRARSPGFGLRTLLDELIQSPLFLQK